MKLRRGPKTRAGVRSGALLLAACISCAGGHCRVLERFPPVLLHDWL